MCAREYACVCACVCVCVCGGGGGGLLFGRIRSVLRVGVRLSARCSPLTHFFKVFSSSPPHEEQRRPITMPEEAVCGPAALMRLTN